MLENLKTNSGFHPLILSKNNSLCISWQSLVLTRWQLMMCSYNTFQSFPLNILYPNFWKPQHTKMQIYYKVSIIWQTLIIISPSLLLLHFWFSIFWVCKVKVSVKVNINSFSSIFILSNLLVALGHPDKDCHEDKRQTSKEEKFIGLQRNVVV